MQLLKGWKFDEIERILSLTKKANSYSDVQLKISIPKKSIGEMLIKSFSSIFN